MHRFGHRCEINKSIYKEQVVLTQDEMISIFSYIFIHSGIPDLVSQLELITAFSSEYMQESPDGCSISQTYIQFLSTITFICSLSEDLVTQQKK